MAEPTYDEATLRSSFSWWEALKVGAIADPLHLAGVR